MQGPTAARIRAGLRAELRHRAHGRLDHARERAAPAGVGGADHAGLGIGEQDRRAVGAEHAERDAGAIADQRVGRRLGRPGSGARATTTSAPWTWRTVHRLAAGAPSRASASARLRSTRSGSSPLE